MSTFLFFNLRLLRQLYYNTVTLAYTYIQLRPTVLPNAINPQQGLLSPPYVTSTDIQKKIVPWTNPAAVVNELFPDCLSVSGLANGNSVGEGGHKGGLVLVAALLSKAPNIGGSCTETFVRLVAK